MSYSWAAPALSTKSLRAPTYALHVQAGTEHKPPNIRACNTTFGLGVISTDTIHCTESMLPVDRRRAVRRAFELGSHVVIFELQEWDSGG